MKKKIEIVIILVLIIMIICQLYYILSLKNDIQLKDANCEAMQTQFALNIQNIGRRLDGEISVQDTSKQVFKLSDVINGNSLICRISERYCEQCVEHATSILIDHMKEFEISNVLIFTCSNSYRNLKLQIKEYGLEDYKMYNCSELNIPIEKTMFPYFMVVDSTLTVRTVYFPTKSTHGTDFDYKHVKMIYDKMITK